MVFAGFQPESRAWQKGDERVEATDLARQSKLAEISLSEGFETSASFCMSHHQQVTWGRDWKCGLSSFKLLVDSWLPGLWREGAVEEKGY